MRLGVGAGFAGDRFDPAVELVKHADLDVLVFECLAERTIALAQANLLSGQGEGFDRRILTRIEQTLPYARDRGTVLISNAGAANPQRVGLAVRDLAQRLRQPCRIAVITGDDVLGSLDLRESEILGEHGATLDRYAARIVSANAYLGADGVVDALAQGADVVLTGRVADAALFLAPLIHEYGWQATEWDLLAQGSVVGHLLECGGQLTGGYFADGERKQVPGLARIGFPFADVSPTGSADFGKVSGSGGRLDRATCLEQLFYEVSDPCAYLTPDVVVDMSGVEIREDLSAGSVSVTGARGRARPETLKVSVGIRDGFQAVAEISYAGHGCRSRGQMAIDILEERWRAVLGYEDTELECSLIGINSCWPWEQPEAPDPAEVRARFAVRTLSRELAVALANEVEALYTNGPAGGGGVTTRIHEAIGIVSTLMPREAVRHRMEVIA